MAVPVSYFQKVIICIRKGSKISTKIRMIPAQAKGLTVDHEKADCLLELDCAAFGCVPTFIPIFFHQTSWKASKTKKDFPLLDDDTSIPHLYHRKVRSVILYCHNDNPA